MKELNLHEVEQVAGGYSALIDIVSGISGGIIGETIVTTMFAAPIAAGLTYSLLPWAGWVIGFGIGSGIYNASSFTKDLAMMSDALLTSPMPAQTVA